MLAIVSSLLSFTVSALGEHWGTVGVSYTKVGEPEVDVTGLITNYFWFGENGYASLGVDLASGENDCLERLGGLCVGLEIDAFKVSSEAGYPFDRFTPFLTLEYGETTSKVKFPASFGMADMSIETDKTNIGIGTWIGGETHRFRVEIDDVEADDLLFSASYNRKLDSGVLWFCAVTADAIGTVGVAAGVGYSF